MCNIKIIPCSGIGKVHGAIAREAAIEVAKRCNEYCDIVCLAHIVTGDEEAKDKIKYAQCITIDGCPAMCAAKNVELSGGNVIDKLKVIDEMKKHRGKKPGDASYLTDDGWEMVDNMANNICSKIDGLAAEVE